MQKRIIIAIAGAQGREYQDVAILQNTRVEDVLGQLNLDGFSLARAEGGTYKRTDVLYDLVTDGQKIFATKSDVQAGR